MKEREKELRQELALLKVDYNKLVDETNALRFALDKDLNARKLKDRTEENSRLRQLIREHNALPWYKRIKKIKL